MAIRGGKNPFYLIITYIPNKIFENYALATTLCGKYHIFTSSVAYDYILLYATKFFICLYHFFSPRHELGVNSICFPQNLAGFYSQAQSLFLEYLRPHKIQVITQREKIIKLPVEIKSCRQIILILPILIVACLLITSCESGVNLVTSYNETFLFQIAVG